MKKIRKEIIEELSKPIPTADIKKLNTKKAMKKYEEQLNNHIIDCCFSVIKNQIDELMNYTLPKHDNNLKINEKKNLMYYRLAINDVKELLK